MNEGRGGKPKEFKVVIDVELPQDAYQRIERAIQKAVITQLAETDVASDYSVSFRGVEPGAQELIGPGGHTDGIYVRTF